MNRVLEGDIRLSIRFLYISLLHMKTNIRVVFSFITGLLVVLVVGCKQDEAWALQFPIVAVSKNGQSPQVQTNNPPQQATKAWKGTVVGSQPNPTGKGFIVKVKINENLSPQYLVDNNIISGTDVEITSEPDPSDASKTKIVLKPLVSNTLPPPPTK